MNKATITWLDETTTEYETPEDGLGMGIPGFFLIKLTGGSHVLVAMSVIKIVHFEMSQVKLARTVPEGGVITRLAQ